VTVQDPSENKAVPHTALVVQAPYALPPYSHEERNPADPPSISNKHGAIPFGGTVVGQIKA
jgi:hypothetical protein